MDYHNMLDNARKAGELPKNTHSTVREAFRTIVKEPEDYAQDMATLDALESHISKLVLEGTATDAGDTRMAQAAQGYTESFPRQRASTEGGGRMSEQAIAVAPETTVADRQTLANEQRERDIVAFETWQRLVAGHVARFTGGMTLDDLPDYGYATAFGQSRNPRTTARQVIRAAGGF